MEYSGPETGEVVASGVAMLFMLAVMLGTVAFTVLIWWKIFSKAGYSGALGLLMLVPIANLVMVLVLAFGRWPIHEELNHLRQYHSPPQ